MSGFGRLTRANLRLSAARQGGGRHRHRSAQRRRPRRGRPLVRPRSTRRPPAAEPRARQGQHSRRWLWRDQHVRPRSALSRVSNMILTQAAPARLQRRLHARRPALEGALRRVQRVDAHRTSPSFFGLNGCRSLPSRRGDCPPGCRLRCLCRCLTRARALRQGPRASRLDRCAPKPACLRLKARGAGAD
jgi:hypothetical protein